jgi:4-hydroxybenzoate polyprenyltransferase/phosphoserine phosphatase/4-amino-4-deoxy-L-arabinose transferase-like glycosyltransferase
VIDERVFRRRLIGLVALALALRILWALAVPVRPVSDSAAYDVFARGLAAGQGYGWKAGEPSAYWPVGTAAAYGALYAVFGVSPIPVVIFNLLLGGALVLLTALIAREWFGERAGLIAGLATALWPSLIAFTTVIASELPFIALLLLGVLLWRRRSAVSAVAPGLVFAAAALLRPQALVIPAVLALGDLLRREPARATLARAGIACAVMAAAILPWSLRNQRELGSFVLISTNGGANLWMGNSPGTQGAYMPLPAWTIGMDEVTRDRELGRAAGAYIRAQPGAFAARTLKKLVTLHDRETIGALWNPGLRERYGAGAERAFKGVATVFWWAALALGLAGAAVLLAREGFRAWAGHPAVAIWACLAATHAVIVVQDRYHFPAIPLVAALAGLALQRRKKDAPAAILPTRSPETPVRALAVDLDGTLVRTDTLWESVCAMAGRSPTSLLALPFWLIGGRAHLKERAARSGEPDVERLPYREEVLSLMRERRKAGGRVLLATAADQVTAYKVVKHLGLFDGVIASDGASNMKGETKAEALRKAMGGEPFDYVGDSDADLPLVGAAEGVWLVEPSGRLRRAAEESGKLQGILTERRSRLKPLLRLLRPHQWAKNALVFIPVIAGHRLGDVHAVLSCALAAACFCLAASGVYILNDLFDLESDRGHPRKRRRPLASGEVPIPLGGILAAGLLAAASALAVTTLSWTFLGVLGGYIGLTTLYSAWLKRKVFIDALLLASLYSYRIFAGGEAANILLSDWLIVFSMFFFLSLALAKRYCEIDQVASGVDGNRRRGYRAEDVALLRTLGPCAGWMAVLVLALWVSSDATMLYPRRRLLWLACPVLLYWLTRYWFLAHRRETHDDPVVFALKDGRSLLAGLATGLIVTAASVPK